jgi:hypothetical protein
MWSISFEVLVAFRWWPSLAETCEGLILLLKILLHLMELNSNFIDILIKYLLYYRSIIICCVDGKTVAIYIETSQHILKGSDSAHSRGEKVLYTRHRLYRVKINSCTMCPVCDSLWRRSQKYWRLISKIHVTDKWRRLSNNDTMCAASIHFTAQ